MREDDSVWLFAAATGDALSASNRPHARVDKVVRPLVTIQDGRGVARPQLRMSKPAALFKHHFRLARCQIHANDAAQRLRQAILSKEIPIGSADLRCHGFAFDFNHHEEVRISRKADISSLPTRRRGVQPRAIGTIQCRTPIESP